MSINTSMQPAGAEMVVVTWQDLVYCGPWHAGPYPSLSVLVQTFQLFAFTAYMQTSGKTFCFATFVFSGSGLKIQLQLRL